MATKWRTLAKTMGLFSGKGRWDLIQVPRGQLAGCCVDSLGQCRLLLSSGRRIQSRLEAGLGPSFL